MGRPKLYAENINLAVPEGTKDRIDAVLKDGEDRLTMIRAAIEAEIKRRSRKP